jgi:hypothetical protein
MQGLWPAMLCSSVLAACAAEPPPYTCALGSCSDAAGHPVDPDVIDPETPAEIAAYPVYCRMTLDPRSIDMPDDQKLLIFRLHHEDPSDLSLFAYSDRSSDAMESFRRAAGDGVLRFTQADGGDLPPDVLTIATGVPARFTAHSTRDYARPASPANIVTKTYFGSCNVKGNV